ncbi:MAG: hypothetical protein NNA20_10255 [Nitrospira sp.]|nr:hypothetical protein [Nitrospira sp.]MCP9442968.1 hypothetical protein [Nitrospira sp.]
MIGSILGVVLLGWISWHPVDGRAESGNETSGDLAAKVFQYLDAPANEDTDRLLHEVLTHPESSIERVGDIIRIGRSYGEQPTGTVPDLQVSVRGRSYPLSIAVPASYHPSKSLGLVVCLHGAGFDGKAYLERWQERLGDAYILACPTYPAGAWFTRRAEELVLATIHDLRRRYRIDPNRIFLTGMSNGGIGTLLIGMHHAPLFAGIAPMAGGLDRVLMPFLENLRNTPVYIIHGAKDEVMPVELSRSVVRELRALGYPYVYREHQREHPIAGGHYFPREELPDLVAWLNSQRRNPLPPRLTVARDASHLHPFGWVRVDATDRIAAFSEDLVDRADERIARREYARLDAVVAGANRIEVKTERIRRYSLFLSDHLIDLSKPVTVVTNGRVSFEGMVTPSLTTLLRQARLRQTSDELFPVHLTIAVEDQP